MPNQTPAALKQAALLTIARENFGLETIETRNSDALDFSEHAVWNIKAAIEAAYDAGRRDAITKAREELNR